MLFSFEETIVRSIFDFVSHASFLKSSAVFFGSLLPWVIGIYFIVSVLLAKNFKLKFYYFSLATLSIILSRGIITEVIRNFIYTLRPFEFFAPELVISHAVESGMLSGHMALLTPLALTFLIMSKRQGLIASLIVLLIGFARIAAGVHWVSDVFMGIAVGALSFLIIRTVLPKRLSSKPIIGNDKEIDEKPLVV